MPKKRCKTIQPIFPENESELNASVNSHLDSKINDIVKKTGKSNNNSVKKEEKSADRRKRSRPSKVYKSETDEDYEEETKIDSNNQLYNLLNNTDRSETGDLAYKIYIAYRGKANEFLQLTKDQKNKIVRPAIKLQKVLPCLSEVCPTQLKTQYGLFYHLERCDHIAVRKCPICGDELLNRQFLRHMKKHGGEEENIFSTSNSPNVSSISNSAKSTPVKKSAKKTKSKNIESTPTGDQNSLNGSSIGINSDEEEASSSFLATPKSANAKSSSSKKKTKYHKLAETQQTDWLERLKVAFEEITKNHFLTEGFEDLRVESNSWILLRENEIILINERFEEESIKLKFCNETTQSIKLFNSMSNESGASVGFCGGPIISTSWCPMPSTSNFTSNSNYNNDDNCQYIAVSTHNDHCLLTETGPAENAIQIWSFYCNNVEENDASSLNKVVNQNRLKFEFAIAHNFGLSTCIKWCPSGTYDETLQQSDKLFTTTSIAVGRRKVKATVNWPRLGLLACTTGVGDVLIFSVPHPSYLIEKAKKLSEPPGSTLKPPIFRVPPVLILGQETNSQSNDVVSTCLQWSFFNQHSLIVAGYSDGTVSVWNLKNRLYKSETYRDSTGRLFPIVTFKPFAPPIINVDFLAPTKIFAASLCCSAVILDLKSFETTCTITSPLALNFLAGIGPLFPGYVYTLDSAVKWNYPNYCDLTTNENCIFSMLQGGLVWSSDISLHHGTLLMSDNNGALGISRCQFFGHDARIRGKFMEFVIMKSDLIDCQTEKSTDYKSGIFSLGDVKEKCRLELNFDGKNSKETVQPASSSKSKETDHCKIDGTYPAGALFSVSWNQNKTYADYFCTGGDAGFLVVNKI